RPLPPEFLYCRDQRLEKRGRTRRLDEMGVDVEAAIIRLPKGLVDRRQHDDRRVGDLWCRANDARYIAARHAWHLVVENDAVDMKAQPRHRVQYGDALLTALRRAGVEAP